MPNWCSNKLFVKNLRTEDQDLLLRLFDQETFCESILPQPDWANTPNEKGNFLSLMKSIPNSDGASLMGHKMTAGIPGGTRTGEPSGASAMSQTLWSVATGLSAFLI